MHYLVFGIIFQIHSASLTKQSLVSIHLLIHLSTNLTHHPALIIYHSFNLSLQAQNLPFQQILPTLDFFYLLDCHMIMGLVSAKFCIRKQSIIPA